MCIDMTRACSRASPTKSSIVWKRFLNFLCTFITSPKAYRNWQAKCLRSFQHGPNRSNWTGGSPIRSRLWGLGMFAFLGLVKIMHVIRRKWLLSLPVGNSAHGTTALYVIKDRPEREQVWGSELGRTHEKILRLQKQLLFAADINLGEGGGLI